MTDISDLRARLDQCTVRDAYRLRRRLDRAASQRDPDRRASSLSEVERSIGAAERRLATRVDAVPALGYPEDLPVTARKDDIAAAIRDHQVVIVAGETGSGKTTQLPKIALGLGRGVRGSIGHTQPRRIAARTVAERISVECGTDLGDAIGYTVRFHDQTGEKTLVKVMTDGILLAEIHDDPMLRQYDTLIIDEAHERSLSIDFLLGYLKRLLPRRPDLKVVITSATIDPGRFSALFDGAPIVEVSGRTYPVEVRYRPLTEREDGDALQAISDAVDELSAEPPGDILVFLSGEREIRDAADLLKQRNLRRTEVLPLYGRLSAAEQHRVFEPHTGRRIVLATNVAETSLTVPGIKYVVDPGTARISRYSQRLKVQRLPIEAISQASARQRSGRCGRTSDGVCIRLYAEEDYEARPEFTDPEILRTNLASVVLRMAALNLGAVEDFPFMDPPERRAVRDGIDLLHELGALAKQENAAAPTLTQIGRDIAGVPVDPRMARMLIAAATNGCLREVLIIVSGLSIQDPRERPLEHQQAADAKHARFADPESDFMAYLNLWNYVRARRKELSGSAFRRICRDEFLHFLRIREWSDVHALLRQNVRDLGLDVNQQPADADRIHESLLPGLLSHVGLREPDGRTFVGARQAKFAIFPGSGLAKKPPRWVMAAELVETTRLWARTNARVDPDWIERLAAHLVSRSYSEPHWSKRRAAVMAYERVTLYGIPLVTDRLVTYGRIDKAVSRELFIRHALVQGEWDTRHAFFAHNTRVLDEVVDLEDRVRRRDIRVDDEALFEFYDRRVGADVVSGRHFDSWWKETKREHPHLLDLTTEDLTREGAGDVSAEEFPTEWHSGDFSLPVAYAFEPGTELDGTTIDLPLGALEDVDPDEFAWGVPGRRLELVAALLKSLPKSWRRQFVPAPEFARRLDMLPLDETLPPVHAVSEGLKQLTGALVPAESFDLDQLPPHLRTTFRVTDEGKVLATGKDLAVLREELTPRLRAALSDVAVDIERRGLTSWDFEELPREIQTISHGHTITGYPTLVDRRTSVDIVVLDSQDHQSVAMHAGLCRLVRLTISSPLPHVAKTLSTATKLTLAASPYASVLDLLEDCLDAAVDAAVGSDTVWDREAFAALRERVRAEVHDLTLDTVHEVERTLVALGQLQTALDTASPAQSDIMADIRVQLSWLVYAGFVAETGLAQLRHLPRYLNAAGLRLEVENPTAETANRRAIQNLEARLYHVVDGLPEHERRSPAVLRARWALEELRVGTFAQRLRTATPVSFKRADKLIGALER